MESIAEKSKYERMWQNDKYRERSPGLRMMREALDWMKPQDGASVTDWGCGTGRVAHAFRELGHPVTLVDIAANAYKGDLPFVEACLWELPASLPATDYGFCADVMEHIPTEHVPAVFEGIKARTKRACFFQIALFKEHFGSTIGETLHLSVFPPEWWKEKVLSAFSNASFRPASRGRHLLVLASP